MQAGFFWQRKLGQLLLRPRGLICLRCFRDRTRGEEVAHISHV